MDDLNLEIHATHHCNLNCKGCLHFSPISDKWFLSPNDYEKSLSSIKRNVLELFSELRIMGGEPLLNKDICDILRISRKYYGGTIKVVTNTLLLKNMGDEFFDCCRENKIIVSYSVYDVVDYSMMKKICSEHNVRCRVHRVTNNEKSFIHWCIDDAGDARRNYENCSISKNGCFQLVGNRLYKCPISAYIDIFSKRFSKSFHCDEFLDLSSASASDVLRFAREPIEFCSHCNANKIYDVEWELSKKSIKEWT